MKKNRIISSNWVVTLTTTLIGVFGALILNEWISSYHIKGQKTIATQNILLELETNESTVKENLEKHKALFGILEFLMENRKDDGRLITDVRTMTEFKSNFPEVFVVEDSTLLSNGLYHYTGDLSLNFDVSYMNLTNIAYETLKSSSLNSSFDFNCLMMLEKITKLSDETLKREKKVLDLFFNTNGYGGEEYEENYEENLLTELRFLIEYENILIEGFEATRESWKNCNSGDSPELE